MKTNLPANLISKTLTSFNRLLLISVVTAGTAYAQSTAITYQGRLTDGGTPASGSYDMQFLLFDTPDVGTGTQQGATITNPTVQVANGVFSVQLDFGEGVFDGSARYLEIGVRPAGNADAYTVLAPRQPVTASPYAIQTLNAQQLGGLPPSRYVASAANGNVGVGTAAPQAVFHVNGSSWFQGDTTPLPASAGKGIVVGFSGEQGYISGFDYGTFTPKNLLLNLGGGNVGIGTTNPQTRLEVQSSGYGITHTDGTARLNTLIFPGGESWFGTSTNHPLYLFANSTRVLGISTAGNVGIGTDSPNHRLRVSGGPPWTSNLWKGALELDDASAIAWRGNAAGQRAGIGHTAGGTLFFRTNSDPGTAGSPAIYDVTINDAGNVGIGTTAPQVKLHVFGDAWIKPNPNGETHFGSPNSETGMSINYASSRADVRFDGATLKLVAHASAAGPPPSTNGIAINTAGNVGIGTTTPTQGKLQVNGGSLNGVYGGSSFRGVWGESTGNLGIGVYGGSSASNGYGLYGLAPGSLGIGVYAEGPRYGGYFQGNVHITGALSKSSGSFQIDHPLDPANKYLYHSFVESPDMMNIYNGNVTTDKKGVATVTLPDYFEALNRDFRYQLTVIGQFAQAIIASKIRQNSFEIKTDKPNVEVSWQVTGIRQDAYANAHRIRVEEVKPEQERGSYLHPEVFGQPAEKGVASALRPEQRRLLKAESEKLPQQTPNER